MTSGVIRPCTPRTAHWHLSGVIRPCTPRTAHCAQSGACKPPRTPRRMPEVPPGHRASFAHARRRCQCPRAIGRHSPMHAPDRLVGFVDLTMRNPNRASVGALIHTLPEVLALFRLLPLDWNKSLSSLFNLMSVINFNPQPFMLDCHWHLPPT